MGSSTIIFPAITDPATLEALACREILALAANLAINKIFVASDNKQVISDIAAVSGGIYASNYINGKILKSLISSMKEVEY
jgi:hypothetical protein